MEKNEILKEMGFSDSYLKELNEFDKATPIIEIKNYYEDDLRYFNSFQDVGGFTIVTNNDNYSKNLIVRT